MKNFTIQLNNPPQGVYFPGATVSGVVIAENDTEPKAYKLIQVALNGEANVHWSESHGSGNNRRTVHYHGNESFIHCHSVLWDKDRDAAGGKYPIGTYHYQFSFQLVAPKLPPSHNGHTGRITYVVVATVQKEGLLNRNTVVSAPITMANAVAISHPSLQQPRSMEVHKTLCCLCCASGPIVITAIVPRTGYCIGRDSIPLEVTIENGSSRNVRQLVAAIVKNVIYRSNGGRMRPVSATIASAASQEPIAPHTTLVWKPEVFEVPYTETTSESCNVIKITYCLKVSGTIELGFDPTIKIPLVLGNIPLTDQASSGPIPNPPTQGYPLGFEGPPAGQDASSAIPLAPYPPESLPSYTEATANQLPPGFVDPIKKA